MPPFTDEPGQKLPRSHAPLPLVRETVCVMLLMGRGVALILVIKHTERHDALTTIILALNKFCSTLHSQGNEQSEYDTVQSTMLVDGRRLAVMHRLNAVPLSTSESGSNDACVTCVS